VEENYAQPALIEEFLAGREFTVAILGNGAAARALPPVEISFDALPQGAPPLYGWEAKWIWDTPENPLSIFRCPAPVSPELEADIAGAALGAFHALGCRDWARVDVRLDSLGRANVLEVNALPGILPDPEQNSCYPKAARAAGLDYDRMIVSVLEAALARLGMAPADPEPWTGSGAPDISKGAAPLGLPVVLGETLAREVGLP
jgi:D-alanine-D-alanine ligase